MSFATEFAFRTVGAETTASAVAGNAMTKLGATLAKRSGVLISNEDAAYELRVRLVPRGGAAPAYTNGRRILSIPPGGTANVAASETVDVYVCNSANAGTTSSVTFQDYAY
jgi:hypothetical protein